MSFCKKIGFRVTHTEWNPITMSLRMSELKALAKERGMRRYSRLRKDGLISFFRDSVRMETNYDDLRLVELRARRKERGLQGYYGLKRLSCLPSLELCLRHGAMSQRHRLVC